MPNPTECSQLIKQFLRQAFNGKWAESMSTSSYSSCCMLYFNILYGNKIKIMVLKRQEWGNCRFRYFSIAGLGERVYENRTRTAPQPACIPSLGQMMPGLIWPGEVTGQPSVLQREGLGEAGRESAGKTNIYLRRYLKSGTVKCTRYQSITNKHELWCL